MIKNDIKNQKLSNIFICSLLINVYSPCTFRRPKPTLKPVRTNAHITPAVVKISLAIMIVKIN